MLSHCKKSFIFDILITGGVGDFLAIESFFTQKEENIRNVFYATRAQKEISELLDFHNQNKAFATVVVKQIEKTNSYGVINTNGIIFKNFVEKPSAKRPQ